MRNAGLEEAGAEIKMARRNINILRYADDTTHGRKRRTKQWKQCQTSFLGAPKSLQMVTAAMKLKDAYSLEEEL